MDSPYYWRQISTVSKGSAQPGANASVLSRLVIPIPPRSELTEIVKAVGKRLLAVSKLAQSPAVLGEHLEELDQSILAKAFRGELVPQDPNDEPASVLLERIREERKARSHQQRGPGESKRKRLEAEQPRPF